MRRTMTVTGALALAAVLGASPAAAQTCGAQSLAVQILGSGGPVPSASASSGYLVWRAGRSIALVDVGGGVFHTFGQAGGRVDQLELVALSHLHPDHVSDLPALLWLTDYRKTPLAIVGPSGNALAPPVDVFLERLVGEKDSALPLVHARGVPLRPTVVDVGRAEPTLVLEAEALRVEALGVPHGVPALAYRMRIGETTIVFGGDQNGSNEAFIDFARDADLLVMHLSLSPKAVAPQLTALHATPGIVGGIAAKANVRGLVLSHIIEPRRDDDLAASFAGFDSETLTASIAEVRRQYGGTLVVAKDLQCVALQGASR